MYVYKVIRYSTDLIAVVTANDTLEAYEVANAKFGRDDVALIYAA